MSRSPLIVDTDVVSFLAKDHPLSDQYRELLGGRSLAVSVVTIGEIEYGMEYRGWGAARKQAMRQVLAQFTEIPAEGETARIWARIRVQCERKGRPIGFADSWIAATAVKMNIPLVSHNARDYESIDELTVITAGT